VERGRVSEGWEEDEGMGEAEGKEQIRPAERKVRGETAALGRRGAREERVEANRR